MAWMARGVVIAAVAGGAVVTARAVAARRPRSWRPAVAERAADRSKWSAVTVNLPVDEVAPDGRLPEPLAQLGDDVEVRVRPAPADKGTEILARPSSAGTQARRALRRALRESKALLETGEVPQPDAPPTTRRTLLNRPLEHATRHGREEGTL
jgi:hypothetical protein